MSTRGSVTKTGATWGYYFSYTHNGKRKQIRKLGFAKQQLAQEALTKALASIDGGKLIGSEKRTVENFLTGWVNDYERSKTVKASTVETTRVHIEKYIVPILGKVKLPALDIKTIESFLGQLLNEGRLNENRKKPKGLSPKTVHNIFGTLHRSLRDAVRWGLLPFNPATGVELPRYERPKLMPWSGEQAGAFIRYTELKNDPYCAVWRLLLVTGLRRGELVGLRWSDVDLVEGKISISQTRIMAGNLCVTSSPKSRAGTRTLSIDTGTVIALAHLKNEQENTAKILGRWLTNLVVTTDDGRALQPKWLYERFKASQRGSGLPLIHLHMARHTAVTWQLSEGTPLHIVSGRTGHSQSSTTANIYAHFMPQQDSQASTTIGSALDRAIQVARKVEATSNEKLTVAKVSKTVATK